MLSDNACVVFDVSLTTDEQTSTHSREDNSDKPKTFDTKDGHHFRVKGRGKILQANRPKKQGGIVILIYKKIGII